MQDFNGGLAGKLVFSVIDLVRGFHHIPVYAEAVCKTAIITPFGLYEFLRMPFGLMNAGQAFQRLMDGVLRAVDFVVVCLDDILVASSSAKEHSDHLRQVLPLLSDNGFVVNTRKSLFGQSELHYLGHLVSAAGITPLPSWVEVIANVLVPTTKVELQRFLGMVNFYGRFMPLFAGKLNLLHAATACKSPAITWAADCNVAFAAAKTALAAATLLHHPDQSVPTSVTADASDAGLGAEFAQLQAGVWRPICFFSRKLSSAETKYSVFYQELLAIYEAINYFCHHVKGKPLTVYTDHMPLMFAFSSASDRSPRQTRHLSYVAE
jgi:hypothetical protein